MLWLLEILTCPVSDHYFDMGYFLAGNEPSFNIPTIYHYAGRPDKSVLRVRNVTLTNFNTGHGGVSMMSLRSRLAPTCAYDRPLRFPEMTTAVPWLPSLPSI